MRNIGVEVKKVKPVAGDRHDPFASPISVRGQQLVGTVVSAKAQRSATIMIERQIKIPKYNRFIKKQSKIQVHNPDSIGAQEGDVVRVMATRPLSKTKHHAIIEIISKAGEATSAEAGNVAVNIHQFKDAKEEQHKDSKKKAKPKAQDQSKTEDKPEAQTQEE